MRKGGIVGFTLINKKLINQWIKMLTTKDTKNTTFFLCGFRTIYDCIASLCQNRCHFTTAAVAPQTTPHRLQQTR